MNNSEEMIMEEENRTGKYPRCRTGFFDGYQSSVQWKRPGAGFLKKYQPIRA